MTDKPGFESNAAAMKFMADLAIETATESLAKVAEELAETMTPEIGGKQALLTFAKTIRERNAQMYPKKPEGGTA